MFSPYYARARARGSADAYDYCSINVALYGKRGHRWAMTERRRDAVVITPETFRVGPSSLQWTRDALTIRFDEWTVPIPSRLRGVVRLELPEQPGPLFRLDSAGRHSWMPVAPLTRCEVELNHPSLRWSGGAYFDCNRGDEPLEDGFSTWQWSRAHSKDSAIIFYEAERHEGGPLALALKIGRDNIVETIPLPPAAELPATLWGIRRSTRCDAGHSAHARATLENAPFYARSLLDTTLRGERLTAFHESLSLDRFRKNWVRMLLPFRMPRRLL